MTQTAISVKNLSKEYRLGTINHGTLYKDIQSWWARLSGRDDPNSLVMGQVHSSDFSHQPSSRFLALNDVSFEVKQGDVVGIIGRNGAGKSTLLKILSQITTPTSGVVKLKGRVASLLEVGTGFHPELTGRDNIFLNGAILGMSKVEIRSKFDEIVAFAEIDQFIDTPVKRYSSGMYVRLAFAVAAHLEPEILIVDEVLSVGDAQFQKKCLGKMEEVGREGQTVLFVSHQMAAIQRLCSSAIVLGDGRVKLIGKTKDAVDFYLGDIEEKTNSRDLSNVQRSGTGTVKLISFSLENKNSEPVSAVTSGNPLFFVFGYKCENKSMQKNVSMGFSLHNTLGDRLAVFYSDYMGITFNIDSDGVIKCRIDEFPFSEGRYYVGARVVVNGIESDWPQGFIGIVTVESGDFYGDGNLGNAGLGPFLLKGHWLKC